LTIAPLDLAALLCSRVCHDVISPVGAIINGLEVLDGEDDAEMRTVAMELIKKSAAAASARLQFCRLAFGAAGSLTAAIDTGDAEAAARALIANDRTKLRWDAPRRLAPKNAVKLLLNLCLVAASAAPRGGVVIVDMTGEGDDFGIRVSAAGSNVRLSQAAAGVLSGSEPETIDGHSIQPYYTKLLARDCGLAIEATATPDSLTLTANRAPAPSAAHLSSNTAVGD
jgi:histidine phosphotransferase ChpT